MAASDWVGASDNEAAATAQPRTWGDTARETVQTADDAVRAAANAMTFGMADRFAGYMGGQGTDAEVKKSEQARERSPYASTAGDVAGSLAIPGLGAEALATRLGGSALARGGAYGLTGAVTGAAQGAGNTYTGDLPDYVRNALIGGAIGAPLGAAGGAAFGARAPRSAAETPTVPELRNFKGTAYDDLSANPAQYDAMHLAHRANDLEQRFATVDRYTQRDSPSTFRALDDMRQPYQAAVQAGPDAMATVDPANIDYIRRGINKIPPSAERAVDRESGRAVKRSLDDFLENPPEGAVMPGFEGAARDAAAQAVLARESNAAYKRAVTSDAMLGNAENLAASNYSGLNLENELRKQYRGLLSVDRKTGVTGAERAGYNADEINRFQQFVDGSDTRGRNALRWAAKTAGGGSGLGFLGAAGIGGGIGAYTSDDPRWIGALGLPVAGLALRTAGNRMALHNVNRIDEMVRQRSPLYQQRAGNVGMTQAGSPAGAKAARDAIALELIRQRPGMGARSSSSDWE